MSLGTWNTLEAQPVPEESPYRRLSVDLPSGQHSGFAELFVEGTTCTNLCRSVLIRSITFR